MIKQNSQGQLLYPATTWELLCPGLVPMPSTTARDRRPGNEASCWTSLDPRPHFPSRTVWARGSLLDAYSWSVEFIHSGVWAREEERLKGVWGAWLKLTMVEHCCVVWYHPPYGITACLELPATTNVQTHHELLCLSNSTKETTPCAWYQHTGNIKYNEPNIILFTTNKFETIGLLPSLPLDCNCEGNSNL